MIINNIIIVVVLLWTGCNSKENQNGEFIDFSKLNYYGNELQLSIKELNEIFTSEPRINSIKSFKEPDLTHYFYFYSLTKSSISFKINEVDSTAIINDAVFADNHLRLDYNNLKLTTNTSIDDFQKLFPKTFTKYVDNREGKFIDYKNGEKVGFKYKIPIRSNRNKSDYFEFEFDESGRLQSLIYHD